MEPLLAQLVICGFFGCSIKIAAHRAKMKLSWPHAIVFSLLWGAVFFLFGAGLMGLGLMPLFPSVTTSPMFQGFTYFLLLPALFGVGTWYLKDRLLLASGDGAGWKARLGVSAASFVYLALLFAVLMIVFVLVY